MNLFECVGRRCSVLFVGKQDWDELCGTLESVDADGILVRGPVEERGWLTYVPMARVRAISAEPPPDLDWDLLAKIEQGIHGRRTGQLERMGYIELCITEAGRKALAEHRRVEDEPPFTMEPKDA